jgi:hypothetical protein
LAEIQEKWNTVDLSQLTSPLSPHTVALTNSHIKFAFSTLPFTSSILRQSDPEQPLATAEQIKELLLKSFKIFFHPSSLFLSNINLWAGYRDQMRYLIKSSRHLQWVQFEVMNSHLQQIFQNNKYEDLLATVNKQTIMNVIRKTQYSCSTIVYPVENLYQEKLTKQEVEFLAIIFGMSKVGLLFPESAPEELPEQQDLFETIQATRLKFAEFFSWVLNNLPYN